MLFASRKDSNLVEQAGATMEEVVESMRRADGTMGGIMAAGVERSGGIAQVSQADVNVDESTQRHAGMAEEPAAAAAAPRDQAARLARVVNACKFYQADGA